MNMLTAIAFSVGNKARAITEDRTIIVYQKFYPTVAYHLWILKHVDVNIEEKDQADFVDIDDMRKFGIDPQANNWQPIN